jgi:hypothetical protein
VVQYSAEKNSSVLLYFSYPNSNPSPPPPQVVENPHPIIPIPLSQIVTVFFTKKGKKGKQGIPISIIVTVNFKRKGLRYQESRIIPPSLFFYFPSPYHPGLSKRK